MTLLTSLIISGCVKPAPPPLAVRSQASPDFALTPHGLYSINSAYVLYSSTIVLYLSINSVNNSLYLLNAQPYLEGGSSDG